MIPLMITFIGSALIVLVALYVSSHVGARPNGNMLLGVSLPDQALNNQAVTDLVKKYRRAYSLYTLIFLSLLLPMPFLLGHFSLTMAYFFLWLFALTYLQLKTFNNYFSQMHALKAKNQWRVGNQQMISIDTEVSRLKDTFMASKQWFLLPLAILIVPLAGSIFAPQELLPQSAIAITTITGLILAALFFSVYLGIGKMRTKTYSEHTEINLHLNHIFKNQWSKCMIILAVLSSLFFVVALYLNHIEILAFVYLLLITLVAVLAHSRIQRERNRLLRGEKDDMDKDDDRYWIGGIFYNNPNDRNLFVEKRLGIGMTMNIGAVGGKLIAAGIVLLLLGSVGFTVWALLGS